MLVFSLEGIGLFKMAAERQRVFLRSPLTQMRGGDSFSLSSPEHSKIQPNVPHSCRACPSPPVTYFKFQLVKSREISAYI